MTDDKKFSIPQLYSETESIKKGMWNEAFDMGTSPDEGPDEEDIRRFYLENGYYPWEDPEVIGQSKQAPQNTPVKKSKKSMWNEAFDMGGSADDEYDDPYDDPELRAEIEEMMERKYKEDLGNEAIDRLRDRWLGESYYYDEVYNNDPRKRRGSTVPVMRSIDFEHECNIWGNNLAENRSYYEPVRKAGGADIPVNDWNIFGNTGAKEGFFPSAGHMAYFNPAWYDMAQQFNPWSNKKGPDGMTGRERYTHDNYDNGQYDMLMTTRDFLSKRYGSDFAKMLDRKELGKREKAYDRSIAKDTGMGQAAAKKVLDRKARRGKSFTQDENGDTGQSMPARPVYETP